MTEEQAKVMIDLLTEIRDEIFRQGNSHTYDGYGQQSVKISSIG